MDGWWRMIPQFRTHQGKAPQPGWSSSSSGPGKTTIDWHYERRPRSRSTTFKYYLPKNNTTTTGLFVLRAGERIATVPEHSTCACSSALASSDLQGYEDSSARVWAWQDGRSASVQTRLSLRSSRIQIWRRELPWHPPACG